MTFFLLFQVRPTRFAMFRHVQRTRPDRKSSENELLGTLGVSPFIVKNNGFERFGKIWKKKHDSEPCVLSVKVVWEVLGLTREHRDPYDLRSLRRKVPGTNRGVLTKYRACA